MRWPAPIHLEAAPECPGSSRPYMLALFGLLPLFIVTVLMGIDSRLWQIGWTGSVLVTWWLGGAAFAAVPALLCVLSVGILRTLPGRG